MPSVGREEAQLNAWTEHTSHGKPFPAALAPATPPDDARRLQAVEEILSTYTEPRSDIAAILELLRQLADVDSVAIPLLIEQGTCLKQTAGILPEGKCFEGKGICHWLLVQDTPEVLVIEDLQKDARSSSKDVVVSEPYMRSYAAAPLVTSSNHCIGSLCFWSTTQRCFTNVEIAMLANFAEIIMRILETAQHKICPSSLTGVTPRRKLIASSSEQVYAIVDTKKPQWEVLFGSEDFCQISAQERGSIDPFWTRFQGKGEGNINTLIGQCEIVIKDVRVINTPRAFDCTVVPAGADKIDDYAVEVAKPFQERPDECPLKGIHFILLKPPKIVKQDKTPFPDLQVGRLLGKGFFGKVYIARWRGRPVALKVVDEFDGTVDSEGVPAEAALLTGISHPNLVRLLAHKVTLLKERRRLWLVSEYCNKGSLTDAVNKGEFRTDRTLTAPVCMSSLLTTAHQVASGLARLHQSGILHCDLSGGNILMHCGPSSGGQQVAKIADFGLCRMEDIVYTCTSAGTHAYVAPEVHRGESRTRASDCYSLGVILYELYCGQRAWAGLDDFQITYAILWRNESLQMPDEAPEDFRDLVMECLNHDCKSRPRAEEIQHRLAAMMGLPS